MQPAMPATSRARLIVALGPGDGYVGGERVEGVVCCAAAAIGHGCGGGWEVARGKMRPFFAK